MRQTSIRRLFQLCSFAAFQLFASAATITYPGGTRVVMGTNASVAGINVGSVAGNPITLANGDLWYNSTTNKLMARINGSSVDLGAGGGGGGSAAWGDITGTLSDQTDLQSALTGRQPLDSDLTAIAALTTTTYGRSLLTLADAAAGRSSLGLGNVENTALSTWAGSGNITTVGTLANPAMSGTATAVNLTLSGILDTGATGSVLTENLQVRSALDDWTATLNADALTANRVLTIADAAGTIATREWATNDATRILLDDDFNVVCEGDSITEGNHVTATTTWPYLFGNMEFCSGRATVTNVGLNGGTIASITTDYSTQVYPYRPAATGKRAVLCVQIGTNDYATVSSATWLASWASYMATARADGFILVAFTATGRTSDTVAQRATRIAYNAGIRASAAWDYLVDLDALLPVHSDTTYYSDGTHPTAEGNRVMASEVTATLLGQRFLGPYSAYTRFEFDSAGNGFTPTFANFTVNVTGATTITSTVDNQVLEITRNTSTNNAVRNVAAVNATSSTGSIATGFGAVLMYTVGSGTGQTNIGQIGVRTNASGSNYGTAVIRLATAGTIADTWTCDHSGNTTQGGSLTLGGPVITTPQALSGAGAVNLTTGSTAFTSTGASQALTLADGTNGQIKTIVHVVDGGSGVLTPTTKSGYTTITFTNVGDSVTLQFFTTAGWCIVGIRGATAA